MLDRVDSRAKLAKFGRLQGALVRVLAGCVLLR